MQPLRQKVKSEPVEYLDAEPGLPVFDLIMSLSNLVDLVSPVIENHHKQVAYASYCIGRVMNLSVPDLTRLYIAGSLHDIGAFSLKTKLHLLDFEIDNPHHHSITGYLLLKDYAPLTDVACLIKHHHVHWLNGAGLEWKDEPVSILSHIIHLADRIAVLIQRDDEILGQVKDITTQIRESSGRMLAPDAVEAFLELVKQEAFWLDLTSRSLAGISGRLVRNDMAELECKSIYQIAELLRRIIDFRSRFTSVHSSGVAAVAGFLASFSFLDVPTINMIKVAGLLHDIGKLSVPSEVLEKPGSLSQEDVYLLRKHTYYSYRAFEHIKRMREINSWISLHHERLDGRGYPFRLKGEQIPLGARIIAVADYFTAITEDRPYRKGLHLDEALRLMQDMSNSGAFDPDIVSILVSNIDDINALRAVAQAGAAKDYRKFLAQME